MKTADLMRLFRQGPGRDSIAADHEAIAGCDPWDDDADDDDLQEQIEILRMGSGD